MKSAGVKKKKIGLFRKITGESRKSDISVSFFAYVMILVVVGLVMMSSASYAWAYSEHDGDGLYYAKRQGMFAIIGIVGMLVFMKVDYHNFKMIKFKGQNGINIAAILYVAVAVLLVAVLIWGGDEGGSMGAKRWIMIGPINFQPSEVAKFALIIFFAANMERDGDRMNKLTVGILKYLRKRT